ncbi:MAG: MYG1 family protein, partial [Chlamydiia bacterium]|nr:MYG1 family protein [Chlamydiia bacterium]
MKQLRSVGIHDGTFHADEVTACALLIVFERVDQDKIIRTRDSENLSRCEYVCDVGGVYSPSKKLFDHHQASYKGELSSAGMVLNYLKEQGVLSPDEYHLFNNSLILGVDAHDNGRLPQYVGYCSFSHVIANFNPISYESEDVVLDEAFHQALQFAVGHLCRLHERYQYNQTCRTLVKKVMERSEVCLFFDHPISWLESFFALEGKNHSALFVIMPAKNHWKLRCIPPDYER